ncbi:4-hydroxy-4-methyl-2-oxoglutarate aldolase [Streptomyces aurantiacus]|uniref:RraA family protein n=1 Tax=Streptomyces aurantiacus TaxID=47760 RepID=UPI00278CD59A|nr:RraA family protein [Streptomyces aurantiacus]MDQ0773636.1 4-hydroxy-4-methyl-2-oxoglutarate aldolase [Streptomyces aurantiacus]
MTETTRQNFDWVDVHSMPKALPDGIVDRFLALDDMSATVADALDALGLHGCVGASTLPPTLPGERVVGRAVTLRNVPSRMDPHRAVTDGNWLMAEIHLVELAEPGDVLVISGLPGVSNMGGIVAATARRSRLAGAVVDGAVRDVAQSRRRGFPIWSRDISPETGKWRGSSVEINATIAVAGVTVEPGDLVIADETGVCFVPVALASEVIAHCEAIDKKEEQMFADIAAGLPMADIINQLYGRPREGLLGQSPVSSSPTPVVNEKESL